MVRWFSLLAIVVNLVSSLRLPLGVRRPHTRRKLSVFDSGPLMGSESELGYYYAKLMIGTPPKTFTVIVDTGSGVTAIPCAGCSSCGRHMDAPFDVSASSSAHFLACGNPFHACSSCSAAGRCPYAQHYTEGSSLAGDFVQDVVWLGGEGSDASDAAEGAPFVFGCHSSETGLFVSQLADGIMGMGPIGTTLVHALHTAGKLPVRSFAVCLRAEGGSLALGGADPAIREGPVQWVPFAPGPAQFYQLPLSDVRVAGEASGLPATAFTSGQGAILDSGTTYTYLPTAVLRAIADKVEAYCRQRGACAVRLAVPGENCWTQSYGQTLPLPTLDFVIGTATLRFLPSQYMYLLSPTRLCLGLLDNGPYSGTVLGNNLMIGFDITFDIDQRRFGFAASHCRPVPAPAGNATAAGNGTAPAPGGNATASGNGTGLHPCEEESATGVIVSCGTEDRARAGPGGSGDTRKDPGANGDQGLSPVLAAALWAVGASLAVVVGVIIVVALSARRRGAAYARARGSVFQGGPEGIELAAREQAAADGAVESGAEAEEEAAAEASDEEVDIELRAPGGASVPPRGVAGSRRLLARHRADPVRQPPSLAVGALPQRRRPRVPSLAAAAATAKPVAEPDASEQV